ncbi:MAG TPA: CHAT domain-containing protein [Campylobacterales bacterium]|nr:CHAT domain-containing protein [Campylobacterales bacterium]
MKYISLIIYLLFIFQLNASTLTLYEAINIDTNKSCKFYEEKGYLETKSQFLGNCKNGFIDGNSTIIHHNGHRYIGAFEKGYYHGYGKFIWDKENYIEGEFIKNYLTGLGKSYNYGNVAEGIFYKNLFIGYGTFSLKFGNTIIVKKGKKELLDSAIYEDRAFWSKSNQTDSLEFLKKSLSIREKYLKNHPLLIDTYDNLTKVLLRTKNRKSLEEAKKYSLKALKIRKAIYNKNSETISTAYNNLALILSDLGDFVQALEFSLKAISIDEIRLPNDDPDLASLYSNISLIYREMSKLIEAKKYIFKSLKIREKIINSRSNSEDLIIDYNTLSLIYQELGDLRQAKKYAKKSLKISKVLWGEYHINVLKGETNLAMIYLDLKEYQKAKEVTEHILSLAEKYFAKDSYELSVIYNNSSLLYKKIDKLNKAKKYGLKGLKISEKILSKNHPELGTTYANLSLLYMRLKNIQEAKRYAYKALKIREVNQNPIALMISYRDISFIYVELKDYDKALSYTIKSFELFLKSRKFLSQLSNRAKKNSLDKDSIHIFNLLDISLLIKTETTAHKIVNLWLKYKGEINNSQNYLMTLKSRTKNDKEIQSKIEELIKVKKDYSTLFIKNLFSMKYDKNIIKLEEKKDFLEEYLSNKLQEYKKSLKLKDINSSQISQRLKRDELYIDFAKTDRSYYIFTIDANNIINYNLLDENATYIDKQIDNYRKNIIQFDNIKKNEDISEVKKKKELEKIKQKTKILSHGLYKILFKDIDNKYNRFIISPDGRLNLLPFEALYTDNGEYLIQDKNITYISSGKAFLKAYQQGNNASTTKQKIAIFAQPNFDLNLSYFKTVTPTANQQKGGEIRKIFQPRYLSYLEYSKDAKIINDVFQNIKKNIQIVSFTKENATKANLFNLNFIPTILHISTHSFYGADTNASIEEESLLKSALALAGANMLSDENLTKRHLEGIVTALDFSTLNLYNSELVFFSSCQSGMGDIHSSEGVYGLNRASLLAGSKRVISTIWSVSDRESAILVKYFYTHLSEGKGYVESLKQSKLDMIKSKESSQPFYWSGFIENGID